MVGLEQRISDAKYRRQAEFERTSKAYSLRLVPSSPPMKVLDIGCGTGVNAEALAAKGHEVSGIDISPVAIEKFRARGFDGAVCNINEEIPFEDGTFDLVFGSDVIEHIIDTERALSEMNRVLRPGGQLVLSTPNSAFWVYRLLGLFGKTVSDLQHPGHVRFFSKAALADHVEKAGFVTVEIAARHMYLVMNDALGRLVAPIAGIIGLKREHRFRTGSDFWHVSRFARKASPFWADALIVTARKPGA
ncbi:MAG: methyltransferase domain-containing protein [Alphaproteobacteria bacterium]